MPGKTDLERLVVSLEANLRSFEKRMAAAGGIADKGASAIEKRFKRTEDMLTKFGRGALAGLSIGTFVSAVKTAIDEIADLGEIAGRIGATTDELQALQRAARATGATSEQMNRALQRFAQQSADDTSYLTKLFNENGESLRNADGSLKPFMDNLSTFSDLIKGAGSNAEQLSIITKTLGDDVGRELVEAFSGGAKGIEQAFAEMIKSGEYHSQRQIEEADKIRKAYQSVTDDIAVFWQKAFLRAYDYGLQFKTLLDILVNPPKNSLELFNRMKQGSIFNQLPSQAGQVATEGKGDRSDIAPRPRTRMPGSAAADTPRGVRNNNLLNIEYGPFAKAHGAFGSDGRFAVFDTPGEGIRAAAALLQSYQNKGLRTVHDMIARWAPANENNVVAYAAAVAAGMGIKPEDKFDFHDPALSARMIRSMASVENGGRGVPSFESIQAALRYREARSASGDDSRWSAYGEGMQARGDAILFHNKFDPLDKFTKANKDAAAASAQAWENFSTTVGGAMENFIQNLLNGQKAGDALRAMLASLASSAVSQAFGNLFGGSGGGLFGGIIQSLAPGGAAAIGAAGNAAAPPALSRAAGNAGMVPLTAAPAIMSAVQQRDIKVHVIAHATDDLYLRAAAQADRLDQRRQRDTLDTSRRGAPVTMARFSKLGTT